VGVWATADGAEVEGYEIHMGLTEPSAAHLQPLLRLGDGDDGAISADGLVAGCYVHGLFHTAAFRHALLAGLGWRGPGEEGTPYDREREFDRLAQHVRSHLDIERITQFIWPGDG
jgi:adenosylcobyric acid synthase